jgi:hypothetical protein
MSKKARPSLILPPTPTQSMSSADVPAQAPMISAILNLQRSMLFPSFSLPCRSLYPDCFALSLAYPALKSNLKACNTWAGLLVDGKADVYAIPAEVLSLYLSLPSLLLAPVPAALSAPPSALLSSSVSVAASASASALAPASSASASSSAFPAASASYSSAQITVSMDAAAVQPLGIVPRGASSLLCFSAVALATLSVRTLKDDALRGLIATSQIPADYEFHFLSPTGAEQLLLDVDLVHPLLTASGVSGRGTAKFRLTPLTVSLKVQKPDKTQASFVAFSSTCAEKSIAHIATSVGLDPNNTLASLGGSMVAMSTLISLVAPFADPNEVLSFETAP